MKMKIGITMATTALMAMGAQADSFGTGANAFSLDFVNIGNAGNTADATGYGAVADSYRMGMHEVTIDQFAKARAADSRIGNGNENPHAIGVNGAASGTSWLEAAKFANYLTSGDAYTGAYQFDGSGTLIAVNRAAAVLTYGNKTYVLPTEDEWYKAAYLKSDGSAYTTYATGNSVPTAGTGGENYANANLTPWDVGSGVAENNGTYDMSGNVWEWNENLFGSAAPGERALRGGAFPNSASSLLSSTRNNSLPTFESINLGFRVAVIPEPSSLAMVGVVGGLGLFLRRRFRR